MNTTETKYWMLSKYVLFKPNKTIQKCREDILSEANGNWITTDGTSSSVIKLILTSDGHLFIHQNNTILENIFLPFGTAFADSLKLFKKKDSLVFLHNIRSETRVFRVQFQSHSGVDATVAMEDCTKYLAKYFAVQSSEKAKEKQSHKFNELTSDHFSPESSDFIPSTVLISKIMQNNLEDMPLIYRDQTVQDGKCADENMEHFVYLCLADPSFPTYVGKVEKILTKITDDGKASK